MRYHLIDRITEVELGKSLRAFKQLTLGEEYLADHFPTFPVMPGVLMLQALVEAGSWLVRLGRDFDPSILVLREAKNVKYGSFFAPGHRMKVTVDLTGEADGRFSFKGKGEVGGQTTVSAQFVLGGYNLRDRDPAWAGRDAELVKSLRSHAEWLQGERGRAKVPVSA
jgi:3-hydroxyacyl-[acyl-carrier-protein] dehydratase